MGGVVGGNRSLLRTESMRVGSSGSQEEGVVMTYSYSQISQYLTCPRRYRHRYLDGWQEKEQRAAMVFGQAFEQAVAALFRHEDPAAALFEKWSDHKDSPLLYPTRDTWDGML